jgi:hypothetical protein
MNQTELLLLSFRCVALLYILIAYHLFRCSLLLSTTLLSNKPTPGRSQLKSLKLRPSREGMVSKSCNDTCTMVNRITGGTSE